MVASSGGHVEIVKLLLDKGAYVNNVSYSSNHVQSMSLACTRWLVIYVHVLDVGIGTYLNMVQTYKITLHKTIYICTCSCSK